MFKIIPNKRNIGAEAIGNIKDISKKNDSYTRIGGTISSSLYLMMQGVQILRIHDVNEVMQAIKVFKEIINK